MKGQPPKYNGLVGSKLVPNVVENLAQDECLPVPNKGTRVQVQKPIDISPIRDSPSSSMCKPTSTP